MKKRLSQKKKKNKKEKEKKNTYSKTQTLKQLNQCRTNLGPMRKLG